MKVIDILNMLSEGALEDGFEFEIYNELYKYDINDNKIVNKRGEVFGSNYALDSMVNDLVKIKNNKINKLKIIDQGNDNNYLYEYIKEMNKKINEIIDLINGNGVDANGNK